MRPTRVRAKPARFHISAPGYTKNAPGFRRKPSAQDISGRMQYAPTRVRAKFDGFHIPAHDIARNPPDFRPKPSARIISRRMQYAPTRVRAKPARFHISPPEYAKNAPDFTLPNRDRPKTCPILGANPCRRIFWGVCNTPLHGYVQNLAGFIFPHTTWRETRRVLDFATRHGAKPGGFWTLPHDIAQNPAGFGLRHTT